MFLQTCQLFREVTARITARLLTGEFAPGPVLNRATNVLFLLVERVKAVQRRCNPGCLGKSLHPHLGQREPHDFGHMAYCG